MSTSQNSPTTLKELLFSAARLRHIAAELRTLSPEFDSKAFLAATLPRLDALSLMERLRLVTEQVHAALPLRYRAALKVLRKLAPRLDSSFVTLFLSDFVALYGAEDFDTSMDALKFFTTFGSAEFAIRHFLRRDFERTLAVMVEWSRDPDEHVRRLASEGSRPRLPWSFRLVQLCDPELVAPILENLKADPSLYVRKSVANHLNDFTKSHPDWILTRLRGWSQDDERTQWIVRHALRSLIKRGDRAALTLIGAGAIAKVTLGSLQVSPTRIRLGDQITLSFELTSTARVQQKLVVDYAIHYVRKEGRTARKVFKLKTLLLDKQTSVALSRRQSIRDFSTRTHHLGRHEVEVMVNGQVLGRAFFELRG